MDEQQTNDIENINKANESLEYITGLCNTFAAKYGEELCLEALQELTTDETTLWGYLVLRREVMEGGFVQLIHNGYGPFFFDNPFAAMLKRWGLRDLSKIVYGAQKLYRQYGQDIVRDCTDEEFMAMFEQYEKFDKYDDDFVENETAYTIAVADYARQNIEAKRG